MTYDAVKRLLTGTLPSGDDLTATLRAVADVPAADPRLEPATSQLLLLPPLDVARAGLEAYGAFDGEHPVWKVVTDALGQITDVMPLVPHFLSAWDATVLDRTLPDHAEEALARHPLVESRMRADLTASTTSPDAELVVHQRAQMAGHYLGKARTASTRTELRFKPTKGAKRSIVQTTTGTRARGGNGKVGTAIATPVSKLTVDLEAA